MRKNIFIGFVIISSIILILSSCKTRQSTPEISNRKDTLSYCVGITFGSNLNRDGFDTVNTRLVTRGLLDYVDHKKLLINEDMAKKILHEYKGKILEKRLLEKFKDNKMTGEKFLKENQKQSGIITLPSGLQYKILKKGNGPKPGMKDLVFVHYMGQFIDGTVFEKHLSGKPEPFFVNRVIKGWQEALPLMPEGSKWRLYVPYQLAYGTEYNPNSAIPPFSTLIFDLELISIKHYQ